MIKVYIKETALHRQKEFVGIINESLTLLEIFKQFGINIMSKHEVYVSGFCVKVGYHKESFDGKVYMDKPLFKVVDKVIPNDCVYLLAYEKSDE